MKVDRSENIVQICSSYLNGFNEIANCQSASEYLHVFLKIASYSLIIPPVIASCLYFYHKKIVVMENTFDGLIDRSEDLKTQEVFHHIQLESSTNFKKKDIIQCLLIKIGNLEYSDLSTPEGKVEIERFQKGFRLLNLEKQRDFFLELIDFDLMSKLLDMDLIPKDIKELHFTLGESKFQDLDANDALGMKFFSKLSEFKSLNKIQLDLKGLGFFGPEASKSLQDPSQDLLAEKINYFYTRNTLVINRGERKYYYIDRSSPISNSIIELRKCIAHANANNQKFEYHLDFINLLVHGDNKNKLESWESDETFECNKLNFADQITTFLHKN